MTRAPAIRIGWTAIRDHPRFRDAAEAGARRIAAHKDGLRPVLRWLNNDLGRSALLARALMWAARDGGVCISDILASARQRGTASDGRVLQLFRRAEAAGVIVTSGEAKAWIDRPLIFQPEYVEAIRERVVIEIEVASLVAPRIGPMAALVRDDDHFRAFLAHLARYHTVPPQTLGPPNPSIRLFMVGEGGLTMLYDLIGRQDQGRERLLEAAPFSRVNLARRHGVSRRHVGRLFEAAETAGYLSFPARNLVVFSPAMSEEAERHFALTFHAIATSAVAAMDAVVVPQSAKSVPR